MQLPTVPTVAIELLELSRTADASLDRIVAVIRSDPAIAAKLLKMTNSSAYGFRTEVTSLRHAVSLLGATVVISMALSFSLSDSAMTSGPLARHYNDYWVQSVVQGAVCELLAEKSTDGADDFFLGGLLMDLGRLAMLKTIEADYLKVLDRVATEQLPLTEVEDELLGFNHVEIGGKLMEHWKIPDAFRKAMRLQHATLPEILAYEDAATHEMGKAMAVAASVGDYFCAPGRLFLRSRKRTVAGADAGTDL